MALRVETRPGNKSGFFSRAGTFLRSLSRSPVRNEDIEVKVISCLGTGAFGTVFLGRDRSHHPIAVKVFNKRHVLNKKSAHVVQQVIALTHNHSSPFP